MKNIKLIALMSLLLLASCNVAFSPGDAEQEKTADQLFREQAEGEYYVGCYESSESTYSIVYIEILEGDLSRGSMSVVQYMYSSDDCNARSLRLISDFEMHLTTGAVSGELDQNDVTSLLLNSDMVMARKANLTVSSISMTIYHEATRVYMEGVYGVPISLGVETEVSTTPETFYGYLYLGTSPASITMSMLIPYGTDKDNREIFEPDNYLTAIEY